MLKRYFFWLIFSSGIFISGVLQAQSDTILLAPATVKGFSPERFMGGLKVQKMDSVTMGQFRFQSLSDLLMMNTGISFKNYGPGQLNTVSFRGTSASHTAVLWNGLNINSPTLGQSDFSSIPVAGFDQLTIQYGSAASTVGTDAVGGSILLNSAAPADGFQASVGRLQDSFQNAQTQLVLKYGSRLNQNWGISGKTAWYDGRMKNRFSEMTRRQVAYLPAESHQKGLVQDLFLRSKNNQELSAHVWLTGHALTLNPSDQLGRELTEAEAYRTMLRYQWNRLSVRTSWVRDVLDYATGNYSNRDHAVTDKLASRVEQDFDWRSESWGQLQMKVGGEWTHFITRVSGYEYPKITENRGDLFLLTRWQMPKGLLLSMNLRQAFVSGYRPPFTPSFGVEYPLVRNARYTMQLKGSVAHSYRVPSLNERYWKVLGTPDIKPESGWNKEVGVEQTYAANDRHAFTFGVTAYHNRVKNWTYWNPGQSFKVENLQEVLARGVEVQAGWQGGLGVLKTGAKASYHYTKSIQEKVYDSYAIDVVGKQLTFVPEHMGHFNTFVAYKTVRLTGQVQGVSKRYTRTDNSLFLDGYVLANILAETTFNLPGAQIRLQGQINNITNTFYLSVRNNAMPGRSFAVNLLLSYNSASRKPLLNPGH